MKMRVCIMRVRTKSHAPGAQLVIFHTQTKAWTYSIVFKHTNDAKGETILRADEAAFAEVLCMRFSKQLRGQATVKM